MTSPLRVSRPFSVCWAVVFLAAAVSSCSETSGSGLRGKRGSEALPLVPPTAEPDVAIGVLDGAEDLVFGKIWDVALTSEGGLVVIDRHYLNLRWFGPDGAFLGKAGRTGSGPGEFREPFDVDVVAEDRVGVIDRSLLRISQFQLQNSEIRLVNEIPVNLRGDQFCATDSGFVVLSIDESRNASLFRLNPSGEVVSHFGELLHEVDPEVELRGHSSRWTLNTGKLTCNPSDLTSYQLHYNLPYLRAFDRTGKEIWRTRMADASAMHVHLVNDRFVAHGPDPETGVIDQGQALFFWGRDTLAVALEAVPFPRGPSTYQLRLFRASTGEELRRYTAPMIVSGKNETHLFGYVNYPFPQIFKYRRPPSH